MRAEHANVGQRVVSKSGGEIKLVITMSQSQLLLLSDLLSYVTSHFSDTKETRKY